MNYSNINEYQIIGLVTIIRLKKAFIYDKV